MPVLLGSGCVDSTAEFPDSDLEQYSLFRDQTIPESGRAELNVHALVW